MSREENKIRTYTGNSILNNGIPNKAAPCYLSDEALQELIAETEAGPMLCPPRGFRDEVIGRVRRKRKRRKNLSLFSYSMKVIAATAAMLGLILIVPENIRPEGGGRAGAVQERQEEEAEWLAEEREAEPASDAEWLEQQGFLYRFSSSLDEACSRLNGRLDQLIGTEGHY